MPPTRDFLSRQAAAFRALTNKYLLLTNSSTYTDASLKARIIAEEVPASFGYTRQTYAPASNSYDAGQSREEIIAVEVDFSATGGTIQYDRAVLISGAAATPVASVTTSAINATANTLEFAASNIFTAGTVTEVTVTAEAGSTVPSELLDSGNPRLLYVVNPVNSGTFSIQLSLTNGGSAIDFSGGSGTLRVRNCSGNIDFYQVYGASTINDGATQTVKVQLNCGPNSANVDAA